MPGRTDPAPDFQSLILRLMGFWSERGCLITQPFDAEKGAGTYNPSTFLRAIGPEPWRAAYVEPSRRPTDGRYGENPNRLYRHHQFQVLLKPSPPDLQGLYLDSLKAIGIHPEAHDIRFVEDNWESPTLGAWGLGWEVWVDGMEATQFTYFQQCGGLECRPVSGELTYGLERLAMYLQDVDNVYDLAYAPGVTYGQVFHQDEVEYSKLTFEALNSSLYGEYYEQMEQETERLVGAKLVIPAYDHLLHAAHAFNALDAKGAISVTERQAYILRIRDLAKMVAEGYLESREALGFPLGLPDTSSEAAPLPPMPVTETAPLFVELGTEELPAKEVLKTASDLKDGLLSKLSELRLSHGEAELFCTPRRIAVRIDAVSGHQPDRSLEVSGPPVKAAFKDGVATKAAQGFAKGHGLSVEQLVQKDTKKGPYLFAVVEEKGQPAPVLLTEAVAQVLRKLSFTRSMRWGTGEASFCRPVVWLAVTHGGEVLPVQFAGVTAGGTSRGHRFMAPGAFAVGDGAHYVQALHERKVLVRHGERRAAIVSKAEALAASVGGTLMVLEDLLDEVSQLVEWPVPLLGSFEKNYLEIPKEVLISEMVEHQRYFPVLGKDGKLLPFFVVVANTEVEDVERSLQGYRRVLSARFSDGAFFFQEDQKRPLFDRVADLDTVRFHRALGSMADRVQRVASLSFELARNLTGQTTAVYPNGPIDARNLAEANTATPAGQLARAAFLAKADLTTQMVFEFPELQGTIGAEYAARSGESQPVVAAIREHYLPRSAEDGLPSGELGALIGLADRLDTLAGIFSANGKGPTGAADPFALRRAALSIMKVLRNRSWHLSLSKLSQVALLQTDFAAKKVRGEALLEELLAFFRARLKASLVSESLPTDVVEAALSVGFDDVVDAAERAKALAIARTRDDFEAVQLTFKRAGNLLKGQSPSSIQKEALSDPYEIDLFTAATKARSTVEARMAARDFAGAFEATRSLQAPLAAFMDGVLVMDKEDAVRQRRLSLLWMVKACFAGLADFDKLS